MRLSARDYNANSMSDSKHGCAQFWALLALIVYAPLPLGSNRPWAVALLGILAGGLLLWNIWWPCGRSAVLAWKQARMPFILLGLWMLLLAIQLTPLPDSWIGMLNPHTVFGSQGPGLSTISIDRYSTRLYLAKSCILTVVFWLAVTLVNSNRRVEWLARLIVFSGLLQSLVGIVLMATNTNFQVFFVTMDNPRAHGTFVSPNNFAGYLELTLATGIGLMIAKLDGRPAVNWKQRLHGWLDVLLTGKAMLRLALIIMVVGLVASRSRMGNTAFLASLLIIGVFAVFFSRHAARTTIVFIVSLIVLDVVIIGGYVGVEKVVQRLENTNIEMQARYINKGAGGQSVQSVPSEESVEERSEAGRDAMQIIRDFPWLGTGGGTFHLAFPHYQTVTLTGYWDHAHNDFVEFSSEAGLLGSLLLVLIVAHSVLQSVKQLTHSRDQFACGMAFASLMGVTSLLIHGTVDFNLQIPANAMLFIIVLSLPYLQIMQTQTTSGPAK